MLNLDNIKNISIRNYLAERRIFPTNKNRNYGMYHAPYREDRNPSLKVDYEANLWCDFGIDEGGSIIELVMMMDNCDRKESIKKLSNENYLSEPYLNKSKNKEKSNDASIEIKTIKDIQHPVLENYLKDRGIPLSIARKYCKEVHYTTKKGGYFFSIGFQNDKGGYELRNPIRKLSSSKAITTIDNNSKSCLVFEGFMNFLSYLTLKNLLETEENVLVLNSVINVSKAKDFLEKQEKIYGYLDNDEAGKNALEKLLLMGLNVIDKSLSYKNFEDLNDYLKYRKGLNVEPKNPKNKHKI